MSGQASGVLFHDVDIFDGEKNLSHQSVLVQGAYIKSVKPSNSVALEEYSEFEIIEASEFFLCPGFIDSHLHILAYAATLVGVDLSNIQGLGIEALRQHLVGVSSNISSGEWLRCHSLEVFDESLGEALNRAFLDEVVPDVPTIIRFNTGHGCLLNSLAMEKVGLTNATVEPPGVTFERNLNDGTLNGVLLEADGFLESRIPKIDKEQMQMALSLANGSFISKGITTVVDASENNDLSRLQMISDAISTKIFNTGIVFMPGYRKLVEFQNVYEFGEYVNTNLVIGPVKIMFSTSSGQLYQSRGELERLIKECHNYGFPVAIHAVEKVCVSAAITILGTESRQGDRLEHVSELSDLDLQRLNRLSVGVSTQPGFIYSHGDRYIKHTPSNDLINLYRLKSMIDRGVLIGMSSDAPVVEPDPLIALHSACTRETVNGNLLNTFESISPSEFLRSITSSNAKLIGLGESKGKIKKGYDADLVLLDASPICTNLDQLKDISVKMTLTGGDIVHRVF